MRARKELWRALYKNYLFFTIHFKVRIIELFWLVNFGNIIQSEHSLHILSEMIWFIDCPILLAPYFLIVQSEELLLLRPVIFTKKQHGARPWRSIYQPTDLLGIILCSDPWMISSLKIETKLLEENMTVTATMAVPILTIM